MTMCVFGANTCIAKSLFDGYTEIGASTKIDNLVSIAHNCKIGENCVLTSGVIYDWQLYARRWRLARTQCSCA
ncbi:hypothetical protein [Vibrio parahaemolyticus]|uniref:hypothetical protein n=1 Tax=Vibrio parahaemolyticus TaxID=670 RepID=UPI001C56D045|nr:hypothetical protein [Vibrio parahaemolyticus]